MQAALHGLRWYPKKLSDLGVGMGPHVKEQDDLPMVFGQRVESRFDMPALFLSEGGSHRIACTGMRLQVEPLGHEICLAARDSVAVFTNQKLQPVSKSPGVSQKRELLIGLYKGLLGGV